MKYRNTVGYAIAAWFASTLAGCGKLVSAEGQVMLDGKPLPAASVTLISEDPPQKNQGVRGAEGVTDAEGRFQLRTVNDNGVLPGRYKAMISKMELPPGVKRPDPNDPDAHAKWQPLLRTMRETVPERYQDPERTPLRVDIPKAGTKELRLELTSKES